MFAHGQSWFLKHCIDLKNYYLQKTPRILDRIVRCVRRSFNNKPFSQFGLNSCSMYSRSFSDKLESGRIGTGYGKHASHSALKTKQQTKEEKGLQKGPID